jgi:molecular chaperone DnaK (HSP70)
MSLPPDTAVSTGAALFAALKKGHRSMSGIRVKTVNSHALGLVAYSLTKKKYVNHVLINSNEPTQTEVKWTYRVKPDADTIRLVVLQGGFPDPADCVKLGEAGIPNLNAESLRGAEVDVAFSFQQNGLLQVRGVVRFSDGSAPVAVDLQVSAEGSMSEGEVVEAETALAGIVIE